MLAFCVATHLGPGLKAIRRSRSLAHTLSPAISQAIKVRPLAGAAVIGHNPHTFAIQCCLQTAHLEPGVKAIRRSKRLDSHAVPCHQPGNQGTPSCRNSCRRMRHLQILPYYAALKQLIRTRHEDYETLQKLNSYAVPCYQPSHQGTSLVHPCWAMQTCLSMPSIDAALPPSCVQ